MKKNKIILLLLILFAPFNYIYAEEAVVKTQLLCDVDDICKKGGGQNTKELVTKDCGNGAIISDSCDVPGKESSQPEDDGDTVTYDVVFLVDMSHSMQNNIGKITKISEVNRAIQQGVSVLRKANENNKSKNRYAICVFGEDKGSSTTKCLKNNENDFSIPGSKPYKIFKKSDFNGDTYMQGGLEISTDLLKKNVSKSKNLPMIILITDGYPTYAYSTYSKSLFKMTNLSAPRYFYYTLEAMRNYKETFGKDALLVTVGVMNKSDPVANFLLNPTEETFEGDGKGNKGLNSDSYRGTNLGNGIYRMWSEKNTKIYDSVAGKYAAPDEGSFYGEVDEENRTITFDISSNWYSAVGTSSKGYIRLFVPGNVKGTIQSYNNSKKKWVNIDKKNYNVADNFKQYIYYDIIKDKKYTKIRIIFSEKNFKKLDKYIETSNVPPINKYYNLVDASFIGVDDSFSSWLNDDENGVLSKYVKVVREKTDSVSSGDITYYSGACINDNFSMTGDYYTYFDDEKKQCVSIKKISIPVIVTEDASFKFGNLQKNIYAGGGYSFDGTEISTNINWHFSLVNDSGGPIFNKVKLINNGKTKKVLLDTNMVYTDSKCTVALTVDEVKKFVKSKISESTKDDSNYSASLSNLFETVDSNNIDNSNSTLSSIVKKNSNNFNLSLPYACIDYQTGIVSYSNDGKCLDDDVGGGNLRYVPLKYNKDSVSINTNSNNVYSNISRYNKIGINVKSTCSVNVKQVLYDCQNNNCSGNPDNLKIAYKYRSIDEKNPFPKAGDLINTNDKIPVNWRYWISKLGNQTRLSNSYDDSKRNYTFNGSRITDAGSYLSWANMNASGSSKFISDVNNGFSTFNNSVNFDFCPLGLAKKKGRNCLDG